MQTQTQPEVVDAARYGECGYAYPLRGFSPAEAAALRRRFLDYWDGNIGRFEGKLPRERVNLTIDTHFALRWVYELAAHPVVLDAVQSVLGPHIMVWNTHWFPKFPGDEAWVSWHQDATYWGLSPPNVTTAWIALSSSTVRNGCLRVIPGSHRGELLPQRETYAPTNMLSRGQEIAVDVDENRAVDLELAPGEFSLHHIGIVHGSGPNTGDEARIGLAVRYVSPDVVQQGSHRDLVMLVRGEDRHGHFDLAPPPERDHELGESAAQAEALSRKIRNHTARGGRAP